MIHNMKKKKILFSIITIITLILLIQTSASAISPTPHDVTPTGKAKPITTPPASPTNSPELDRIQKIKEMVAKKVQQLNLVEKRGIIGDIKDTSTTQIIIKDEDGNQRTIDIDELTKFQDSPGSSKTFGVSDIKAGNKLAFIGLYNKDTKRLLARFVTRATSIPEQLEGVITDKNVKDFTLTITTQKGTKKTIDIQVSTKIQLHTKDGLVKSGFSKIETGQRIFVVGFPGLKDKTLFEASRVIVFQSIPPSSEMLKFKGGETPESSGSGKSVTP